MGSVKSEFGAILPGTLVINERTDLRTTVDRNGYFVLDAEYFDKIRFVAEGYDILIVKLNSEKIKNALEIELLKTPTEIQEIAIKFIPSGELKKDLVYFKTNPKTEKLNAQARMWLRDGDKEIRPQNTIPSSFRPPDLSAGQIPLLGISSDGKSSGILGMALGLFTKKKEIHIVNSADELSFLKKVKSTINHDYFYSHGLDEYELELFLSYANRTRELAKRFSLNFSSAAIESELKLALVEYLKTHKIQS